MIIVRLYGGLGNQMFQFAAGMSLAKRHGVALHFDPEWFDHVHLHQGLELPRVFGLDLPRATPDELRRVLGVLTSPTLRRLLVRRKFRALLPSSLAIEPHFHYWSPFDRLGPKVYLDGHWQSERYFSSVEAEVRQALRFQAPLDVENQTIVDEMGACESVSLHVRRGDFAENPVVRSVHGVDLAEYYRKATDEIKRRTENPYFYIFSDDPDWARAQFGFLPASRVIDHNRGGYSYLDMQLMSCCRHHVIANSTFSWWGAWLNSKPGKIVVAPRRWFSTAVDTSDLTPCHWNRL